MQISKTEFWGSYKITTIFAVSASLGMFFQWLDPVRMWIMPVVWAVFLILTAIARGIYVSGRKSSVAIVEVSPDIKPLNLEDFQPDNEVVASTPSYELQFWYNDEWLKHRTFSSESKALSEMDAFSRTVPSGGPYRVIRTY